MTIASRTPEGEPIRCSVCGMECRIEPSPDTADAPCPSCGQLLWFFPQRLLPSLELYVFDPGALAVLRWANWKAEQHEPPAIDTTHLLYGISSALSPNKDEYGIREKLEAFMSKGASGSPSAPQLFTDSAMRALDHAQEESASLRHDSISVGHLLLGILALEDEFPARLLREIGVDPTEVRTRLSRMGRAL